MTLPPARGSCAGRGDQRHRRSSTCRRSATRRRSSMPRCLSPTARCIRRSSFVLSGNDTRPAPGAAVPDPGGLLRSRLRAARGPPRRRAGRAQPHAPPGLPEVDLRRGLSGRGHAACASSPSSATARSIAAPPRPRGARPRRSLVPRLPDYVENIGRRSDPLSRRLCRAALGADARQGRARSDSTSSIAGRAAGGSPPRSPAAMSVSRAIRSPMRPAMPAAASSRDGTTVELTAQARAGPPVAHAPRRCRRASRHVEGLDACRSPAPDESGGAAAKADRAQQDKAAPTTDRRGGALPRRRDDGQQVKNSELSVIMATLPLVGPAIKHRQPMTGARMIIVASALAFAVFLLWASLAQVDEVTRGRGQGHPLEQAPDHHRGRSGDGERAARPLRSARAQGRAAGSPRQSGKPIAAGPAPGGDGVPRRRAHHG